MIGSCDLPALEPFSGILLPIKSSHYKILTFYYSTLYSSHDLSNSLIFSPAMSCLSLYALGIKWLAVFLIRHAVSQLYALSHAV